MIRVTVFNENVEDRQCREYLKNGPTETMTADEKKRLEDILSVHPNGVHNTIAGIFNDYGDIQVRTVTMDMPMCGLTDDVLDGTDVLIWWAHIAHDDVPDEIARRVRDRILMGMGFIALHSAHPCKVMQLVLGTSGSLGWREDDFCRVWNVNPSHPIAAGIPKYFELDPEEMYSEPFDIPSPDELVFISWYRGGEVFRSGCCWNRGYGRIFYFQPGHETNPSYHNEYVRKIIVNATRWAAPRIWRESLECPHIVNPPEKH